MKVLEVLETVIFKTCRVSKEIIESPDGSPFQWTAAYSVLDGSYIGDPKNADYFERKGIFPQRKRPDCNTASIGFCPREQKWFGWSHRALYGFGIGSKVKKGDCGYRPSTAQELYEAEIKWGTDPDCVEMLKDKIKIRTNMVDCGPVSLQGAYENPVPSEPVYHFVEVGRGEWEAKTLDDAKQMAIDFSDSVS